MLPSSSIQYTLTSLCCIAILCCHLSPILAIISAPMSAFANCRYCQLKEKNSQTFFVSYLTVFKESPRTYQRIIQKERMVIVGMRVRTNSVRHSVWFSDNLENFLPSYKSWRSKSRSKVKLCSFCLLFSFYGLQRTRAWSGCNQLLTLLNNPDSNGFINILNL